MDDRFLRGYIAGISGGIVMTLTSVLFFSLGITPSRLIDRVGIIFLGYVPTTILDQLVCLTIQLGHAAVMGILFTYLVTIIGSKYLKLKGSTLGAITWFTIFSVGSLFKLPLFYNLPGLAVAAKSFHVINVGCNCRLSAGLG